MFKPGQSGNPLGRPASLRPQLEKRFGRSGERAWQILDEIMSGRLESIQERVMADGRVIEVVRRPTIAERKEAAVTVIEYIEGKPPQRQLNANVNIDLTKADQSELNSRVMDILARYAAQSLAPVERPAAGPNDLAQLPEPEPDES